MNEHDDQSTPHSGSRWEPTPAGSPEPLAEETVAMAAEPPVGPPAGPPVAVPVAPARRGRRRIAVAGAAVALVALGGVGGFAIGHAAGTDDDAGQTGVVQDFDGDGFHGGPRDGNRPAPPDFQGGDGTTDDGTTDDGDGTT